MNDSANPGWWSRHWKWAVPTGCLSLILLAGLTLGVLVVYGLGGLGGLMKPGEPFRHAAGLARHDPAVIAALGSPVDSGWMRSGRFDMNDDGGEVDAVFPLSGPKGEAEVHLRGERRDGRWTYSRIEVELDDGRRIDLLAPAPAPALPAQAPAAAPQDTATQEPDPDPSISEP